MTLIIKSLNSIFQYIILNPKNITPHFNNAHNISDIFITTINQNIRHILKSVQPPFSATTLQCNHQCNHPPYMKVFQKISKKQNMFFEIFCYRKTVENCGVAETRVLYQAHVIHHFLTENAACGSLCDVKCTRIFIIFR